MLVPVTRQAAPVAPVPGDDHHRGQRPARLDGLEDPARLAGLGGEGEPGRAHQGRSRSATPGSFGQLAVDPDQVRWPRHGLVFGAGEQPIEVVLFSQDLDG